MHDHGSHEEHGSHAGHEAGGKMPDMAGHATGHGAQHPAGMAGVDAHQESLAGATWNAAILGLLVAGFGLWLLAQRGTRGGRRDALAFALGLVLAGLAAASPLVSLFMEGSHLAYMVQLELLMTVSPVLLSLGLVSASTRGVLGWFTSRLAKVPALGLGVWLLVMYGSHLPAVHELVMGSAAAYAVQLLVFPLAGLLFWVPVLVPGETEPMARIRYLVLAQAGAGVLAAVLIWFPAPIYDHGAVPFGLSAPADQRLSGATMMVVDMLVAATVAGWIFLRAMGPEQRIPPAVE